MNYCYLGFLIFLLISWIYLSTKDNDLYIIPCMLFALGLSLGLCIPVTKKSTTTKVEQLAITHKFDKTVGRLPVYNCFINNKWVEYSHIYNTPSDSCYEIKQEDVSLLGILITEKSFIICY